jgi:hypothetical protein
MAFAARILLKHYGRRKTITALASPHGNDSSGAPGCRGRRTGYWRGLLLRSIWILGASDYGFDLDRGLVIQVRCRVLGKATREQFQFFDQALARLRAACLTCGGLQFVSSTDQHKLDDHRRGGSDAGRDRSSTDWMHDSSRAASRPSI